MKEGQSLGVYVHIPYCIKKCRYCDFLSAEAGKDASASESIRQYVQALIREIQAQKNKVEGFYTVSSIFFGGGTPSLLDKVAFEALAESLYRNFSIEETAEITVECNPETITEEKLISYREQGVNRLSFGLQSTDNRELILLGRIHSYEKFLESYFLARECGFSNINIDLMSALPEQTCKSWERTLKNVIGLKPEHISAYSLIIEEGTPFYEMRRELALPSEEEERGMYHQTKQILKEYGYHRYEISNYAKQGFESRHNLRYWQSGEYLGLGLGASSYMNGIRFSNTRNIDSYFKNSAKPECLVCEREELNIRQKMEEYMFLGLRKMDGILISGFEEQFLISPEEVYGKVLQGLEAQELIERDTRRIWLTEKGIDVSNMVFAEFLL